MKRLVLGDMHGLFNIIEDIYNAEKPDSVIILGDYFDSFTIDPIIQNLGFRDLLELRKLHIETHWNNKNTFILLLGNHDFHYLTSVNERYSGYNNQTAVFASEYVHRCIDKEDMQMIYIDDVNKTIYSHAGITNAWLKERCNNATLGNVNTLGFEYFTFTYKNGGNSYGSSMWNGPLWVRPEGLYMDPYRDENGIYLNQIFGHTHRKEPTHKTFYGADFYNLDCLPYYYMIEELDNKTYKLIDRKIIKVDL
jgi:predicted phosphodiesterase